MDLTYRVANGLGRAAIAALGAQVRWTDVENIPRSGPVILAANHVSYPDFVFIGRAAIARRRPVRFMTRHDVWAKRRWGAPMSWMKHIPVDREAPAGAYLRARSLLREGEVVGAFPEAGISYSFTVRPLMKGVASLARETGAPVVPVAVWGSQRIYSVWPVDPDGREYGPDWTRRRRVDVSFGEPLRLSADGDLTEFTHQLGHRLTDLLEELQLRPHHRPVAGEDAPWYPLHLGGHALSREEAMAWDSVPRSAVMPTWGPC